jgi:hypothetical protein
MNCTVLTFLRYFIFFFFVVCLKLWFECCDFLLNFSAVWMVSVLDYGWVVSSWYRLISLALCFPVFFLVSATSSYVDDIAYIKILYEQKPMWVFTAARTGCSFLSPFLGLY